MTFSVFNRILPNQADPIRSMVYIVLVYSPSCTLYVIIHMSFPRML